MANLQTSNIPSPPQLAGGGQLPYAGVPYGVVSPTSIPDFTTLLNYLLQSGGQAAQGVPQLSNIIGQGANSPLMQQILGPALQNLIPGEQLARQNLSDEFRASGMMGSGAEGMAGSRLENALQGQRGNLISQVMSSILSTLVSGMNQQAANQFRLPELVAQALGISRPSVVAGSGGSSGVGGGRVNDPFAPSDPYSATSNQSGGAPTSGGAYRVGQSYAPSNAYIPTSNSRYPSYDQAVTDLTSSPSSYDTYGGISGSGGPGYGVMYDPYSGSYVNNPAGTAGYTSPAGPGYGVDPSSYTPDPALVNYGQTGFTDF